MQWESSDRFSEIGSFEVPRGDFVAVGIAPSSEVDACVVGSHRLGVNSLVQWFPDVRAIRGVRVGNLPDGSAATTIGQRLVLQLYERGDPLIPPGPRAPLIVSSGIYVLPAAFGATNPILRVPFAGRKQCAFSIKRTAGSEFAFGFDYFVRGVRYNTRTFQKEVVGGAAAANVNVETAITVLAAPTVSRADGVQSANEVFYVGGGGDNQEAFDELELYARGTDGGSVYAQAEARGDIA